MATRNATSTDMQFHVRLIVSKRGFETKRCFDSVHASDSTGVIQIEDPQLLVCSDEARICIPYDVVAYETTDDASSMHLSTILTATSTTFYLLPAKTVSPRIFKCLILEMLASKLCNRSISGLDEGGKAYSVLAALSPLRRGVL